MNCCNVSVVIPTFNRVEFLERAIRSVVNQSLACREILVIDDGSTDNTQKLVKELQQRQPIQIRYHYQENSGPAAARNIGIMRACCETIAFLDSDDHWHKNKLQLQYQQLKANDGFLISHTKEKWLRRGRHLNQKQIHIPRHGDIFEHCLQLCAVGMSTVMVDRELFSYVGYFDETLPCCEDYDMWLRVSRKHHFLLIDDPLTIKEGGRDDQVSVQYRAGMDRFRIRSLKKMLDSETLTPEQRRATLSVFLQKAEIYGNGCFKHGRPEEGKDYLDLIEKYKNF